ncbi:unnamed protein product [Tilletia controversa]|uniref:Uncharacterized protein n=3 Tax=Tilletia TaxID=13289 RepID=A0A8X7MSL0_9BASI|nr:hypothetical protein CF336_g3795 [Tilletia laevis]KAE8198725.1 hypothetical protein CF328_g3469 [Tilletia controversa]KAE8261614.1 hypothetical protein A4X03_0g3107 [Tilletia caries]KAE8203613.1 hypothetical protein CF335_g2952 [Tilletia laevis]KAE8247737.1 hypothetical protein A4X06_0g4228 [Tilletia controversa]
MRFRAITLDVAILIASGRTAAGHSVTTSTNSYFGKHDTAKTIRPAVEPPGSDIFPRWHPLENTEALLKYFGYKLALVTAAGLLIGLPLMAHPDELPGQKAKAKPPCDGSPLLAQPVVDTGCSKILEARWDSSDTVGILSRTGGYKSGQVSVADLLVGLPPAPTLSKSHQNAGLRTDTRYEAALTPRWHPFDELSPLLADGTRKLGFLLGAGILFGIPFLMAYEADDKKA